MLAQIMRIAKLLEAQQPPPAELLGLALQYLAEEGALETPTPEWAEVLGLSGDEPSAAPPILSQRQVTSLVDGLQQEITSASSGLAVVAGTATRGGCRAAAKAA